MAVTAKALGLDAHVYGLDSFRGMPETDRQLDLHSKGDFADVSLEELDSYVKKHRISNVTFVQGLFEQTAHQVLQEAGIISLAHIDCDIYSAVKFAYHSVKPNMIQAGGYIVFDDPLHGSCLGAFQAVEEFTVQQDRLHAEQCYPHLVYRYPPLVNQV
jgi:hypothetical protein